MVWCGIHGHDRVAQHLRRGLQRRRLASSFLFVGPSGIGKRLFALRLAQGLLCDNRPETQLEPCLSCPACQQINNGAHPDVEVVGRPAGKSFIPLELFIGDREHRSREGMCHRLALKPASGKRRVAIIEDADFLNAEGANCLLKTLEEPPPGSVLILVGTSEQRQLPTIRSRCQIVRFQPLTDDLVRWYLTERGLASDEQHLQELVELAEGSLERATEYAGDELSQFRQELPTRLGQPEADSQVFAKWVSDYVGVGGERADLAARRDRLRRIVRLCLLYYRQRLRAHSGVLLTQGSDRPVSERTETGPMDHSLETDATRVELCLDALEQVDANANLATLIECWADNLLVMAGASP